MWYNAHTSASEQTGTRQALVIGENGIGEEWESRVCLLMHLCCHSKKKPKNVELECGIMLTLVLVNRQAPDRHYIVTGENGIGEEWEWRVCLLMHLCCPSKNKGGGVIVV